MNERQYVANRIFEVVSANLLLVTTWGYAMFSREMEEHEHVRNKVSVIWISSLFDTVEAGERFIVEAERDAVYAGFNDLEFNAKQMKNFCHLAAEAIQVFNREEQVHIQDTRNQWVHG